MRRHLVLAGLFYALGALSVFILSGQRPDITVQPAQLVTATAAEIAALEADSPRRDVSAAVSSGRPVGTAGKASGAAAASTLPLPRTLAMPVDGVDRSELRDAFADARGERTHEAIDILAPRRTPVLAVDNGRIAKLFSSKAGGLTIYLFDPSETLSYYYAHLDGYAPGLKEGQRVNKGDVIGYVGTTGNAPPDTPHLHFAVSRLTPERQWWKGEAINPYPLLR